jgi:hypothetical protein
MLVGTLGRDWFWVGRNGIFAWVLLSISPFCAVRRICCLVAQFTGTNFLSDYNEKLNSFTPTELFLTPQNCQSVVASIPRNVTRETYD